MNRIIRLRLLTILALTTFALTAVAQKENMETIADAHHLSAYFVAALIISVFAMLFSNRLFYFRQQEVRTQATEHAVRTGTVVEQNAGMDLRYDQTSLYFIIEGSGEKLCSY